MKKAMLLFLFLPLFIVNAQDYYPLTVGNLWKYKHSKSGTMNVYVNSYDKFTDLYLVKSITKFGGTIFSEQIIDKREGSITIVSSRGGLLANMMGNDEWQDINSKILELP